MEYLQTKIPDVWLIKSSPYEDERGTFLKAFAEDFLIEPLNFNLTEVNVSSTRITGSIRGMHMQDSPCAEKKIVRCLYGSIFDVAIDMRPNSPTYLRYVSQELSALNYSALVIPEGFAHGFQTLEDNSIVHYITSQKHSQKHERGIRYNDPAIDIDWPMEATQVSKKDREWPLLSVGD
jgi:dTDP-4-dehydrorhamnose 3,5-epimerase